jgi:CheY-like chemotaxis protein
MHFSMEMKMRIVVCEDDPDQLRWLKENLTSSGHEVFCAMDGDCAFTCWKIYQPDLVLTDYFFPGKLVQDGKQLIEAIREVDPSQPFICQTRSSNAVLPCGVPRLLKPYHIRRVLRMIARTKRQWLPLFERSTY